MAEDGVDPAELRRRMAVCFSAAELKELADKLGVAEPIDFDRGAQDAARELVRHFEKAQRLSSLVKRLREARPLVEWPDLVHDRPTPEGPLDVPPDPPAEAAVAPAAAAAPEASEQAEAPPPSSAWIPPGHAPKKSDESPRGIDPRILIAVSGLTLAAAIVAFVAGRASGPSGGAPGSSSATPAAGSSAHFRPDGPAGRAALVLERGLANVARACEVDVPETPTSELLRGAYEQCGPQKAPNRPKVPIPPAIEPLEPTAAPEEARLMPPVPPPPEKATTAPGDRDLVPPASAGCMGGCDSSHKRCKSACGAEPAESSKYADYQGCLGKCLKDASKCRLTCQ